MRRWKRGLIMGLATVVGAFIASEVWPDRTEKLLLAALGWSAGLESKSVTTSYGPVAYLEGGEGQTIVFLHGIFALKEHWIDMSREVSGDYRVVLLDLPGFGQNQRLAPQHYDYALQAANVLEALDTIGVSEFHIAGNSMGAQIAGQIAVSVPDRVTSVAFIGGPAGVSSPVSSDMEVAIAAQRVPLVVTTQAEYDARMEWLFPQTPFIPRPVARHWARNEVMHAQSNHGIWQAVAASDTPRLEDLAPDIRQRSLVLWCDEDRIFHISGAPVLVDALPHGRLHTLNGCGHLPMLDRPRETGKLLLDFLNYGA